jgi:hypothetical protein
MPAYLPAHCCPASSLADGDVEAHFLTTDHNGRNDEEAARITRNHGRMVR